MTTEEQYKNMLDDRANGLTYEQIISKYKMDITKACLRFRLKKFKDTGGVRMRTQFVEITKAQLQSWIDQKLSISQVFLQTGIAHNFIYAALNKYGLSLHDGRARLKNKVIDKALRDELLKSNSDSITIAHALGVSNQQACRYIREFKKGSKPKQKVNKFNTKKSALISAKW